MKECKLCNVNGWCESRTTDFSINSLMRPAAQHHGQDPADAVLLSTYLLKLGDYPLYPLHDYHSNVGEYRALK
ncbi:unnamed protein product [Pieris macdunnoughi]|uniref:Uncharacterized protein n=1 Tax=Pieris macdunnoughi TaxID=345717 RepID=A0A821SIB1_9NEOP|nr:unnamed protein product [Pieris macdunnoughi]